jgi:hypothetical protein
MTYLPQMPKPRFTIAFVEGDVSRAGAAGEEVDVS